MLSDMVKILQKPLILIPTFLLVFYIIFSYLVFSDQPLGQNQSSPLNILANLRSTFNSVSPNEAPTDLSHLVFGIAGSVDVWKTRKSYIESWWRPNVTRGLLFLEHEPTQFLPWPLTSPPYTFYEDTSKFKEWDQHGMRHAIRMIRVIQQTFIQQHGDEVRWYVMADDDTVLFLDNLVSVLSRYDHTKYFYIGHNSECVVSNSGNSFEMAFGGAGYALSRPLVELLSKNMDVCLKRYPQLWGSDHILQACLADLGVSLTHEKGFHQIDLNQDLSGFLSAHPQSPFLSLHHIDSVDPIFPSMDRDQAINHLMEAGQVDQSRLLQQTICYQRGRSWSFSIAWGYSVQLYEISITPSFLMRPLATFGAWTPLPPYNYVFNVRWLPSDPCEAPHVFFFESARKIDGEGQIVTSYTRGPSRAPNNCSSPSASNITKVLVFSPTDPLGGVGSRRECCDIIDSIDKNIIKITIRPCLRDEIMGLL